MRYLALLSGLALCAMAALSGPAGADPTPTFSGCGVFAQDAAGDASDQVADPAPDEVEIENGFINTDPNGATFNLTIKNLSGTVPPPATSITYDATYTYPKGTTSFVRAYIDFTGSVVYEYGHTEALAASTRYARDGAT